MICSFSRIFANIYKKITTNDKEYCKKPARKVNYIQQATILHKRNSPLAVQRLSHTLNSGRTKMAGYFKKQ